MGDGKFRSRFELNGQVSRLDRPNEWVKFKKKFQQKILRIRESAGKEFFTAWKENSSWYISEKVLYPIYVYIKQATFSPVFYFSHLALQEATSIFAQKCWKHMFYSCIVVLFTSIIYSRSCFPRFKNNSNKYICPSRTLKRE